jgi:hypothetical protein
MPNTNEIRSAYVLACGILIGMAAWQAHWLAGAGPIAFAMAPAAAIFGHFILSSWRNEFGAKNIEPIAHYALIVFSIWVIGWLLSPSQWAFQLSTLLLFSLLAPAALDWLLERTSLHGKAEPNPAETI